MTGRDGGCVLPESVGRGAQTPTGEAAVRIGAAVLAGTHAWSSLALERVLARPLLPIVGRPLIAHVFDWFSDAGVSRAAICANGDTPVLRRWLGTGLRSDLELDYYQDVMPRGPAGSIRDAALDSGLDLLVAIDASVLPRFALGDLLSWHLNSKSVMTVVCCRSREAGSQSDLLAPAGIYVCSRRALEAVQDSGYQDIKEGLIPRLHEQGLPVAAYSVQANEVLRVRDSGSYLAVNKALLSEMVSERPCPCGYRRRGQAWIHHTASIAEGVKLIGPVIVEPETVLKTGVVVVGPALIGPYSRIGTDSTVSRSVFWERCWVGSRAVVDQCVVTTGAAVADEATARFGVVLADRRSSVHAAQHLPFDLSVASSSFQAELHAASLRRSSLSLQSLPKWELGRIPADSHLDAGANLPASPAEKSVC